VPAGCAVPVVAFASRHVENVYAVVVVLVVVLVAGLGVLPPFELNVNVSVVEDVTLPCDGVGGVIVV